MKALVLGSSGQLATHLRELWPQATFWGRAEADLSSPSQLQQLIVAFAPALIVNAAAYTAVDRAESDQEHAWRVNGEAPAEIARAAAKLDVPLLHVSTDYVFDGNKQTPYLESDPVAPLNVYGRTKLAGELAVATLCRKHWIVRTSWVFSEHGQNFVKTMLRLARERDRLTVVGDQLGRPTYAGDLARAVMAIVSAPSGRVPYGLHHLAGGPPVSWHGFACSIVQRAIEHGLLSSNPEIAAIATADYPLPARRPLRAVLESGRNLPADVAALLDWQSALDTCLSRIAGKSP